MIGERSSGHGAPPWSRLGEECRGGNLIVRVAERLGVEHLPGRRRDRRALLVVEVEGEAGPGRIGGVLAPELREPHAPEPIHVGVVKPEDRVERRGGHDAHEPAGATDLAVHVVVRSGLDRPGGRPALAEVVPAGDRPAEPGCEAGNRLVGEVLLLHGELRRDRPVGERLPVVDGRVAPRGEQRVVRAVRELRLAEGGGQPRGVAAAVVVPVRKRPGVLHVVWDLGVFADGRPHDALEPGQVHAVPGQEEPGVVLALVAELVRRAPGRHAVHLGLVGPARRIVGVALLHHAHGERVRLKDRVPGAALLLEAPGVPADQRVSHAPSLSQGGRPLDPSAAIALDSRVRGMRGLCGSIPTHPTTAAGPSLATR